MNPVLALKQFIYNFFIRNKFPRSVIHNGATADAHSKLGEYAVLFRDASLINSTLGAYSYLQSGSVACNAEIGKFCSIARGVDIGLSQHSISHVSSHPMFFLKNTPLPKIFCKRDYFITSSKTIIEHDVWIGQKAMIMSGIKIATGAVIGAGAVVTIDVPPYAIVGGIPAKIIKFRFNEHIRNQLQLSKWWEMPEEWLMTNHLLFQNPEQLLHALDEVHYHNNSHCKGWQVK